MVPMNFKQILSRDRVLHVRSDSRVFKDERYYKFFDENSIKYAWRHSIKRLMDAGNYEYLDPYANENESNKCFEIMYNINYFLLEKTLDEIGAKLVTITKAYTQTLGGFKYRSAKMPMPKGILFDNLPQKMLFLIKNPNLYAN